MADPGREGSAVPDWEERSWAAPGLDGGCSIAQSVTNEIGYTMLGRMKLVGSRLGRRDIGSSWLGGTKGSRQLNAETEGARQLKDNMMKEILRLQAWTEGALGDSRL